MTEAMSIDGIEPDAPAPAAKRGRPARQKRVGRPPRLRAEATVRAEPVREPVRASEATRTRRRNGSAGFNKYDIPAHLIPEGTTFEWKRHTVYGEESAAYEMHLLEMGWLPVQASQVPGMMRENYSGPIMREGLMLYERPVELTQEAKNEEYSAARKQMRDKEEQLNGAPPGHFSRTENPQTRARVTKSYEPMAIPEE